MLLISEFWRWQCGSTQTRTRTERIVGSWRCRARWRTGGVEAEGLGGGEGCIWRRITLTVMSAGICPTPCAAAAGLRAVTVTDPHTFHNPLAAPRHSLQSTLHRPWRNTVHSCHLPPLRLHSLHSLLSVATSLLYTGDRLGNATQCVPTVRPQPSSYKCRGLRATGLRDKNTILDSLRPK